jgi:hypothetical protein
MSDLVAQHRREGGVVPRHREDAGVDHDLAARQTVGVGLVLPDQRHVPVERRLVAAGDGLDPLGDPLHLRVCGARRHDLLPILLERFLVLLASQLRLLFVAEPDVLRPVGHRRRLLLGMQQHDSDDDGGDHDGDQWPGDEEGEHAVAGHEHPLRRRRDRD